MDAGLVYIERTYAISWNLIDFAVLNLSRHRASTPSDLYTMPSLEVHRALELFSLINLFSAASSDTGPLNCVWS